MPSLPKVLGAFLVVSTVLLEYHYTYACSTVFDCLTFSPPLYVVCDEGQCTCLFYQGFRGNASAYPGCFCPYGDDNVRYKNSGWQLKAYCNPPIDQTALAQANSEVRISQVMTIYRDLVTPTAGEILDGQISLGNVFAPYVTGLVDPLGPFSGKVLQDYYFVFAALRGSAVTNVFFYELNYNDTTSTVSVRVAILFSLIIAPGVYLPLVNITESGFYRFAPNNTVVSAAVIIHNMGPISDPSVVPASQGGMTFGGNRTTFIHGLCTDILSVCNSTVDPAGFYANWTACVTFLTDGSVRVASYGYPAGNTDICRRYHATLALKDPFTHCPHAGRTGGGQCVDPPYYTFYSTITF